MKRTKHERAKKLFAY